ncbi:transposable element Tcb2 transposase [Trichonephila clavipes]|nr:transposable element Tcb2 transposase [Trichonephila clavipes]
MDWPARSPDLNPIEHVWDFLGKSLAARTLPPVTIRELRLALQDEWAAMPQQLIDTLILSMGRRCETCLAVRGDHIPYMSLRIHRDLTVLNRVDLESFLQNPSSAQTILRGKIPDVSARDASKHAEGCTTDLQQCLRQWHDGVPKIVCEILHAEIVESEIEVVSPYIVPSGNFAELNRTVTCMVLKANDRRTSCPCHDEFRGPRSDYVRQVASENNNNNFSSAKSKI